MSSSASVERHTVKLLYKMIATRGFESTLIFTIWENLHPESKNFFPTSMKPLRGFTEDSSKALYLHPKNKMAAVQFPYIKNELLHALNFLHGFKEIKEIRLAK